MEDEEENLLSMDNTNLHLRAERNRLLAAVAVADAVVPTTSTKPIQTHLLLEAKAAVDVIDKVMCMCACA